MFRLTSKHTLLPVVLAMVAALPAHADETLTQNTVYTGAKYVRGNYDGAGHSVTARRTHGIFCRPLSQDSLITADL